MKPSNLLNVLICCVVLSSCNKDKAPPVNNAEASVIPVYAGQYDQTFDYYEFNPPYEIAMTWDSLNLYGVGEASFDFNVNGNDDVFLTLKYYNEDSIHLISGLPSPFPSLVWNSSGGVEVATSMQNFPIGLGQSSTAEFAGRYDLDDRIDQLDSWSESVNVWAENPGGAGAPPFGPWYTASASNYFGYRVNGDKYGWIEMDLSDPKKPESIEIRGSRIVRL